jgi:hypothetical protein
MKRFEIARVGLVAASLAAASFMSSAQAEEGELVKNLLGALGVIPEDKGGIDYRERAPLVLPPRMELRDPAPPGSTQTRNPQWPNDPDVAARKRQAAESRLPITETQAYRMDEGKDTRLTVQEMRAGRHAGAGLTATPQARTDANWVHPDVLRAQHQQQQRLMGPVAGGETGRRALTEPPSAYRQSATGQPIKGSFEARSREDEADPKIFLREQQRN